MDKTAKKMKVMLIGIGSTMGGASIGTAGRVVSKTLRNLEITDTPSAHTLGGGKA